MICSSSSKHQIESVLDPIEILNLKDIGQEPRAKEKEGRKCVNIILFIWKRTENYNLLPLAKSQVIATQKKIKGLTNVWTCGGNESEHDRVDGC